MNRSPGRAGRPSAPRRASAWCSGRPSSPDEDRAAQLDEAGVLELGLGLDPGRPHDGQRLGEVDRVAEQGRLADAGLAADEERPAATLPGVVEEALDTGSLGRPAEEHVSNVVPGTSAR